MVRLVGVFGFGIGVALSIAAGFAVSGALAQGYGPAAPFEPMSDPLSRAATAASQSRTIGITEADRRRLAAKLETLTPQRPGIVDAYVVAAALDSDPVFAREAREAGKVLAARYDAAGRTIVLAGPDGRGIEALPRGSLETLESALKRVAAVMDPNEDVLILYITSHGNPDGIAYIDQGQYLATLPPRWLDYVLRHEHLRNRLVMISACFSGKFVPMLSSADGAIITAAAADRTSFGCASDNDWTFFGDALINHALRKNQPLAAAFGEAQKLVSTWEASGKLIPSQPQIAIGPQAGAWLGPIEARMPKAASVPVGRPAIDAIEKAVAANH